MWGEKGIHFLLDRLTVWSLMCVSRICYITCSNVCLFGFHILRYRGTCALAYTTPNRIDDAVLLFRCSGGFLASHGCRHRLFGTFHVLYPKVVSCSAESALLWIRISDAPFWKRISHQCARLCCACLSDFRLFTFFVHYSVNLLFLVECDLWRCSKPRKPKPSTKCV